MPADDVLATPGDDGPAPALGPVGARLSRVAVVALLVGAVAGGVAVRAWDSSRQVRPAASPVDVQVSLGAYGGGVDGVQDGDVVVAVSTVMRNQGTQALTLVAVKVTGAGAGFLADPPGGPSTGLPVVLPPDQFVDVRFGLTSPCSVAVRPVPTVTLVLVDPAGVRHEVASRIPDLDTLWGQSLDAGLCPGG